MFGAGERAPEFVRQAEADDGEDLAPAPPGCCNETPGNPHAEDATGQVAHSAARHLGWRVLVPCSLTGGNSFQPSRQTLDRWGWALSKDVTEPLRDGEDALGWRRSIGCLEGVIRIALLSCLRRQETLEQPETEGAIRIKLRKAIPDIVWAWYNERPVLAVAFRDHGVRNNVSCVSPLPSRRILIFCHQRSFVDMQTNDLERIAGFPRRRGTARPSSSACPLQSPANQRSKDVPIRGAVYNQPLFAPWLPSRWWLSRPTLLWREATLSSPSTPNP